MLPFCADILLWAGGPWSPVTPGHPSRQERFRSFWCCADTEAHCVCLGGSASAWIGLSVLCGSLSRSLAPAVHWVCEDKVLVAAAGLEAALVPYFLDSQVSEALGNQSAETSWAWRSQLFPQPPPPRRARWGRGGEMFL